MPTLAHFLDVLEAGEECVPIPQPEAFEYTGLYPNVACIKADGYSNVVVSLSDFKLQWGQKF